MSRDDNERFKRGDLPPDPEEDAVPMDDTAPDGDGGAEGSKEEASLFHRLSDCEVREIDWIWRSLDMAQLHSDGLLDGA
jgi:hypothetical protein